MAQAPESSAPSRSNAQSRPPQGTSEDGQLAPSSAPATSSQLSPSNLTSATRRERALSSRWDLEPFGASPLRVMRRMMEDMASFLGRSELGLGTSSFVPQVDVFERDDRLVVHADLPGVRPEDLEVEMRGDELIIRGERTSQSSEEREGVWRSERRYGSFQRVIALPEGVSQDEAEARFDNGVLEVIFPLSRENQGRRIEVKSSAPGAKPPGSNAEARPAHRS